VTYAVLFLIGSLPLLSAPTFLKAFLTACLTGFCYGVASIITGYFDRWGWIGVKSLNHWHNIVREFFSSNDNRL
jgi:hypothetical protein